MSDFDVFQLQLAAEDAEEASRRIRYSIMEIRRGMKVDVDHLRGAGRRLVEAARTVAVQAEDDHLLKRLGPE